MYEMVKAPTDYLPEKNFEPQAYKWKADRKENFRKNPTSSRGDRYK
jgi:hypothetical protein